uniref:transposase n=1 Tax=Bacillus TaxID=1386 RepID=UPI0003670810
MKQKYNEEFKKMVVELYRSGQPVKELSSEYGVSEVTIYKWIKTYSPVATVDEKEVTPNDWKQMQKEILRLKEENEILKKAMA